MFRGQNEKTMLYYVDNAFRTGYGDEKKKKRKKERTPCKARTHAWQQGNSLDVLSL
jgi:hypothetical protein